jgi:hypothetical protein
VGEAGGLDLDEGVFAVGATRLPDGGLARRIAAAIEGLGRLGVATSSRLKPSNRASMLRDGSSKTAPNSC